MCVNPLTVQVAPSREMDLDSRKSQRWNQNMQVVSARAQQYTFVISSIYSSISLTILNRPLTEGSAGLGGSSHLL